MGPHWGSTRSRLGLHRPRCTTLRHFIEYLTDTARTSLSPTSNSVFTPPGFLHPCSTEIIAIVDEERTGFDEMEAMPLVSLFWRRRRQPNSKTERRQRLELRKQVLVSSLRLPFAYADAVWRTRLDTVSSPRHHSGTTEVSLCSREQLHLVP